MSWSASLECSVTLKRVYNENIQRRNKFKAEYDRLSCQPYRAEDGEKVYKRIRYLKENMNRFQDRAHRAIIELAMRVPPRKWN